VKTIILLVVAETSLCFEVPRLFYLIIPDQNKIKMASPSEDLSHRRKLALTIGNGNYTQRVNKLDQSVKNANDLANSLKTINFEVTRENNIPKEIMKRIQEFTDKIMDGDLILVYFSGHSYQVKNNNYLIPTDDARIDTDDDVETFGSNAERIVDRLIREKPSCVAILILDCYRPYVLKSASTSNRK